MQFGIHIPNPAVLHTISTFTYGTWFREFRERKEAGWKWIYIYIYTGCLQINGAVSKVNKKFISHLTRAKRTPLAAANVPVSYVLITILQRFARVRWEINFLLTFETAPFICKHTVLLHTVSPLWKVSGLTRTKRCLLKNCKIIKYTGWGGDYFMKA